MRHMRRFGSIVIAKAFAAYVSLFWLRNRRRARVHQLPGTLSITLTSYPPRYTNLALTLKSLLGQSVRPDHVNLWIAEADMAALPANVASLRQHGLIIRPCQDFKSFTKIIPALLAYPGHFLVTADDDQYYPNHWLQQLVGSYRPGTNEVVCARAHRIRFNSELLPLRYFEWELDIVAGTSERCVFPTGVGGVLYEPGIFHSDVTRDDLFRELCPTADDVWLYWMAALNGARFRKVGRRRRQIIWPDSQHVSLLSVNRSANDEQIRNMIHRYGFPHEV